MKNKSALVMLAIVAFLLSAARGSAATIGFTVDDLGGGRWQHDYYVSDVTFNDFEGFSILFEVGLYSDISAPSTANPNWFLNVLQPDGSIPGGEADGYFDAIALPGGTSLVAPFSIQFAFGGPGTPGSQLFELTRFEPFDPTAAVVDPLFLDTLGSGQTAPVPEPGTLLLVGSGAALVVRRARRKIATRT